MRMFRAPFMSSADGRPADYCRRLPAVVTALLALLLGLGNVSQLHAQCGADPVDKCADDRCRTDNILLNTGYDPATGTTYPVGAQDGYWHVVEDKVHNLPVPRPADVIGTGPDGTGPLPNSEWIGGSNPSEGEQGDITYERCFCVCDPGGDYEFDLNILVDDAADVYFEGHLIASIPKPGHPVPTNVHFHRTLTGGHYCIQIVVHNLQRGPTGLDLEGSVTGPNLLRDECCTVDEPIEDVNCQTDHVTIATDNTWTIVSGPVIPPSILSYPRCATIITLPHQLWATAIPGTNWIGTSTNGQSGSGWPDIYVYRKSFCVEREGTFVITIQSRADNFGTIKLNGVALGSTAYYFNPANVQTVIVALHAGCNCFEFEIEDYGGVTGLDVLIDIQGGLLRRQECCDCAACTARPNAHHGDNGNDGNDGGASGVNTPEANTSTLHPTLVSIPNPSTGDAVVHYVLDRNADAVVELFNTAGERVLVVDEGAQVAGEHAVPIATKGLPAGAYRLRLKYGEKTLSIPVQVR